MPKKFEKWGNFVKSADTDLLALGVLQISEQQTLAIYHGVQALEKYLKALKMSILDPSGSFATADTEKKWIKTHSLSKLAQKCQPQFPFYIDPIVLKNFKKYSEFDQATRYPWVLTELTNGNSTDDLRLILDYIKQARQDIPITKDDYPLGLSIRGHFHRKNEQTANVSLGDQFAVLTLRKLRSDLDEFIRWQ